ncbi:MAG: LemA family protein [Chitinophagaceae bacterium]|jgi:LemA protein|nr:LemA family protein [Chitinophagaceae bacterium]MCU0405023.1 LemA family protein [Chitinophagaceae bacterium]
MSPLLIAGIAIVLIGVFVVAIFNKLTKLRIMVKEGWSGIATFLQQRTDLIPNLVETVKGYALHESKTLTEVVKWRNRAVAASSAGEQMEASAGLNRALVDFFALAEQYPDLKANSNFLSLQSDLKDIEGKLNQSRRYYNGTVRDYNQAISIFPNNLIAGLFNFSEEPFFQEEPGAAANPKVSFS